MSLLESDPEIFQLIQEEKARQENSIQLVASENYTSKSVMEATGSILTNKYSEGEPGKRYYGSCQVIDKIEVLCKKRALDLFKLDSTIWDCNVKSLSGTPANFATFTALLEPGECILGLDLHSGGHLSHGHSTRAKKLTASSIYFTSVAYHVDPETGLIDYDECERLANSFCPKVIICGASAYTRDYDYKRFSKIAKQVGAYLVCDMAHTSGLIASGLLSSPFDYCDVVTSTTHKTLRGPRSGIIFSRLDLKTKIDEAVFPATSGGPHNHTIAALAVALKEASQPDFKVYSTKVVKNAETLARTLASHGYTLATGGTENHIVLWDLRPQNLSGSKMEKLCEACDVAVNKNFIIGDNSTPGAIRLGTSAMTTRYPNMDFEELGDLLHDVTRLALQIQVKSGKLLKNFEACILEHGQQVQVLKERTAQILLKNK